MALDNYFRFPIDLGDESQGHFMKIRIFPSQAVLSAQPANSQGYTVCLFVPGTGLQSPMIWEQDHDYDDVKLARLGTAAIGAVSKTAEAVAGAAVGLARLKGQGAMNPKVQVLYSNTQLRRFSFSYFMAPSSETENARMQQIIKMFRKYSAPELRENTGFQSLWFIPPAEFEITFHKTSTNGSAHPENFYVPKISRCVLQKVDVNYSQQGDFSTFKDGSPTAAQLTLTFREMRIISQKDVEDGY